MAKLLRADLRCFFFFQAEDGIRDYKVTGVQTCALPISALARNRLAAVAELVRAGDGDEGPGVREAVQRQADPAVGVAAGKRDRARRLRLEIGRASCRERV